MISLRFLLQTGAILFFVLVCYVAYEQALHSWNREYVALLRRYIMLEQQQEILARIQEDLLLQINSQSDPAWVELVLIKRLGLVPEGQTKVYFE